MDERCCQVSQTIVFEIRLASSPLKIFESFFQRLSTSRLFYEYFVVKSHSRVLKLIVEFKDASKLVLKQNPLTLNGDTGIFLGQGTPPTS
jgi:hypothetical protein